MNSKLSRIATLLLLVMVLIVVLFWVPPRWRAWEWVALPALPEKIVDIVQGAGYAERGYTSDSDIVVMNAKGSYFLLECLDNQPCDWKPVADSSELVGEAEFCYQQAPPENPPVSDRVIVDKHIRLVCGSDEYVQYSYELDSDGVLWQWETTVNPYSESGANDKVVFFIIAGGLFFLIVGFARSDNSSPA